MATHAELVSDIAIATTRPDLATSGEIDIAIRRATLKLHSMAFWPKDLAEVVLTFNDATQRNQSIATGVDLQRFRAVKYIRENFPIVTPPTPAYLASRITNEPQFFTKQEPDAILDNYGTAMNNIWYLGGSNINLRCRLPLPAVTIGYYQYPIIQTAATFNSWIADIYPFAIIDEAARMIFKTTGYSELAREYDNIMAEHRQYMIQNFVDGEGR